MKATHKDVVQKIFDTASMQLAEEGAASTVYFIVKDDVIKPVFPDPEKNLNMAQYSSAVVNMAHDIDADAVILISEQYTVNIPRTDPRSQALLDGLMKPSEQPDREESLVVIYIEANGQSQSLFGVIDKNISSQVRYIRESSWMSNVKTSLIPPWREVPKDS
jgi:hypothetical protein